jgi:hypothetical protein
MPQFPLDKRHVKQARELYKLRAELMSRRMTNSRSLIELERRLSVHLAILARMSITDSSADGNDTQRFLHFATALQSREEKVLFEICRLALEQLCDDSLSDTPLHDVFALYPPAPELLQRLYREMPEASAAIFSLWRRQNVELPAGLVNQAKLQREDLSLQREVLAYAANHESYGIELFRAHYSGLLQSTIPSPLDESLLEHALWGGLVRGDSDALLALQRAVERVESTAVRTGLLRLMALNGSPEHLPILLESTLQSTASNIRCLSLSGQAEGVEPLIERLGQPQCAHAAHDGWVFLTGYPLPERPMLMLVNPQGEAVEAKFEGEGQPRTVPDSQAARLWWECHRATWGDQRRIMGQSCDTARLISLCCDFSGETAVDLMDLLALRLKRPLGISAQWGWQALRLTHLKRLGERGGDPVDGEYAT